MAHWADFEQAEPALAVKGRERLHGRPSYLATVRRDGSPRVHPVTPIVAAATLYVFMEPTSPKGKDLQRNPRYALHCGVEDVNGGEGEFLVRGSASLVNDPRVRAQAAAASPYTPADRYILFQLGVDQAELRAYAGGRPVVSRWLVRQASAGS